MVVFVVVVDSYTIGSGTMGAVTRCAVSIMPGAPCMSSEGEVSIGRDWEYGSVIGGGGCANVREREGVEMKLGRLILELMAFSCWLRVGWQGASSYVFLT